MIGIIEHDLDVACALTEVEEELRLIERHQHETLIVLAHADAERARYPIGLDARRRSERRDIAARRDQRDRAAGDQVHLARQASADDDGLSAIETGERPRPL